MNRLLAALLTSAFLQAASGVPVASAAGIDGAFNARYDNPEDVFALGDYIRAAAEEGQFDQAISTLEEHLVRHGNDGKARLAVARLYANVGSWELARDQARSALSSGQLNARESREATALARRAERAANGVEWFLDLGGGVRFSRIDVDMDFGSWKDRSTTGAFARAAGAIRFDLGTPLGNALILSGTATYDRRYEDAYLGGGPALGLADGDMADATHARGSVIYDLGLPVTAIDAARIQVGAIAEYATLHPDIFIRSIGGIGRLVLKPNVDSQIYAEYRFEDLSGSTGINAETRHSVEAGASFRISQAHVVGIAARGIYDYTSGGARSGDLEEVEISYRGLLPYRPMGLIWSHELSLATGTFSGIGLPSGLAVPYSGSHWRAEWAHMFHFDGANRLEISYSATRRDFDQAIISGRSSLTQTVSLGFTHRF